LGKVGAASRFLEKLARPNNLHLNSTDSAVDENSAAALKSHYTDAVEDTKLLSSSTHIKHSIFSKRNVPLAVVKALHLSKSARLSKQAKENKLIIRRDTRSSKGETKQLASENSLLMRSQFLRFLALDITQKPHSLQPITADLLSRIEELVGDEDIDLNAPLQPEDDD
jgi:antitoxin PrlF